MKTNSPSGFRFHPLAAPKSDEGGSSLISAFTFPSLVRSPQSAVLCLLLLLLSAFPSHAQLSYETNINGTITITGGCPSSPGAVTIPETINGLSVTTIGDFAFSGCTSLTSVTIPNSVRQLLESAFEGCVNLIDVMIPNGVTSIRNEAFSSTGLTNISIPQSVTLIEDSAFGHCHSLTDIRVDTDNSSYTSSNGVLDIRL